jgi:DNA-binding CsgD family transcriptional regulator
MTQTTLPDPTVLTGYGGTVLAFSRRGENAAAADDDLATEVRALEARKALLTGAVAALAAPDDLAAELFEAALADPGARWWPFDLARVHLLYGEWLLKAREIARSRYHLEAALAAFERLGAPAWAERAAAELATTGLATTGLATTGLAATGHATTGPVKRRREAGPRESLTAQELQVADLAAAGLSNREIAVRLCLSHRTVGAHLYRIFPKLGISSRAALRDALTRSPCAVQGEENPRRRSG